MKSAYIDEAGIGGEPWVVVAGIIIDPDAQYESICAYLSAMADHYALAQDREGFIFHATDIFSGRKRFDRKRYSLEVRREMLTELCKIPARSGSPVVAGLVDRERYAAGYPEKTKRAIVRDAHCIAYASCVCNVDAWLLRYGSPGELATLIAEDNGDVRRDLRQTQRWLNGDAMAQLLIDHEMGPYLPVTRIVDTPHFVEKADSPILQVADACAFVIARHASGLAHVETYIEVLKPRIYSMAREERVKIGQGLRE